MSFRIMRLIAYRPRLHCRKSVTVGKSVFLRIFQRSVGSGVGCGECTQGYVYCRKRQCIGIQIIFRHRFDRFVPVVLYPPQKTPKGLVCCSCQYLVSFSLCFTLYSRESLSKAPHSSTGGLPVTRSSLDTSVFFFFVIIISFNSNCRFCLSAIHSTWMARNPET